MDNYPELLKSLALQEETLQFDAFDNAIALAIGLDIVESARLGGKSVTVNITVNGLVLFHHAMIGACADQADWIRRKNNVVNRYGHSSYYVGNTYKAKGDLFENVAYLDAKDHAAHGGAFPITIRNVGIVGTITVSGLPQAEDHALVVQALKHHLAGD